MKTISRISTLQKSLLVLILLLYASTSAKAQRPDGGSFGFGLIVGEPLGATVKIWTSSTTALVGDLGASYFGSPRFDGDYIWHFNAFHSSVANLYAGPGIVVGFGNEEVGVFYTPKGRYIRTEGSSGIGVRAIFGVDIMPRNTPLEFFFEAGPLIAISPGYGTAFDIALGLRFYP